MEAIDGYRDKHAEADRDGDRGRGINRDWKLMTHTETHRQRQT